MSLSLESWTCFLIMSPLLYYGIKPVSWKDTARVHAFVACSGRLAWPAGFHVVDSSCVGKLRRI